MQHLYLDEPRIWTGDLLERTALPGDFSLYQRWLITFHCPPSPSNPCFVEISLFQMSSFNVHLQQIHTTILIYCFNLDFQKKKLNKPIILKSSVTCKIEHALPLKQPMIQHHQWTHCKCVVQPWWNSFLRPTVFHCCPTASKTTQLFLSDASIHLDKHGRSSGAGRLPYLILLLCSKSNALLSATCSFWLIVKSMFYLWKKSWTRSFNLNDK